MKEEIRVAVEFIATLFKCGKSGASTPPFTPDQIDTFKDSLTHLLFEKLSQVQWDTERPWIGNGYRALWTARSVPDILIRLAAHKAHIPHISQLIPTDFVVWIDPNDVSFRLGDYGSVQRISIIPEALSPVSSSAGSEEQDERVGGRLNSLRADAKEFHFPTRQRRERNRSIGTPKAPIATATAAQTKPSSPVAAEQQQQQNQKPSYSSTVKNESVKKLMKNGKKSGNDAVPRKTKQQHNRPQTQHSNHRTTQQISIEVRS